MVLKNVKDSTITGRQVTSHLSSNLFTVDIVRKTSASNKQQQKQQQQQFQTIDFFLDMTI